ncbi:hypothetical protein BIU82_00900 [Arthrobacter sp. SW1]|nr:hypothetical protein BIU82_00900 [Arthrobacter sp. SW1]
MAAVSGAVASSLPDTEVANYISRTYGTVPLKVISESDAEVFPFVKIDGKSGAGSILSLDDWDAIVVVGFGFSLIRLVERWGQFQPDSLNADLGGHYLVPEFSDGNDNECIDSSQAVRLLRRLREMTAKPIYLVPAPLPAEWAAVREGDAFSSYRKLREAGDERRAVAAFDSQLRRLPGRRIKPIRQPQSLTRGGMWTPSEYCLGRPEDAAEGSFYARGDFYHMNKEFGEVYLREILRTVIADSDSGSRDGEAKES